VVITDINEATLREATDQLTAAGHRSLVFVVMCLTRTAWRPW
jgi:DNA-binding LacI/PurR family transcriptional regulator